MSCLFTALIGKDSFLQVWRKSLLLTFSTIIQFRRILNYVSITTVACNHISLRTLHSLSFSPHLLLYSYEILICHETDLVGGWGKLPKGFGNVSLTIVRATYVHKDSRIQEKAKQFKGTDFFFFSDRKRGKSAKSYWKVVLTVNQ